MVVPPGPPTARGGGDARRKSSSEVDANVPVSDGAFTPSTANATSSNTTTITSMTTTTTTTTTTTIPLEESVQEIKNESVQEELKKNRGFPRPRP